MYNPDPNETVNIPQPSVQDSDWPTINVDSDDLVRKGQEDQGIQTK